MPKFSDGLDVDLPTEKEYKVKKLSKTSGFCLACNSKIKYGNFCDSWCKEEYETETKIRKAIYPPKR
jgi:hypothetical protein